MFHSGNFGKMLILWGIGDFVKGILRVFVRGGALVAYPNKLAPGDDGG